MEKLKIGPNVMLMVTLMVTHSEVDHNALVDSR